MELLTYLTKLVKSKAIEIIRDDFRFSIFKKVFLTTFFFLIFFSCLLQAQTITLNSVDPNKSLVGNIQNVTVTFTLGGAFNKNNICKVELSDASGSFNIPSSIGQKKTNKSTSIACIIPATLPAGTGYLIRVVSTLPVVISGNYLPFTVTPIGAAGSITGSSVVCQGQTNVAYSVLPIAGATHYAWTLPTGCSIGSGENSSSITVNFSQTANSGNISVYGTDGIYNGTSSSLPVTVNQLPLITSQPLSSLNVCPGTSKSFSVTATGTKPLSYQWFRNGILIAGATKAIYSVGKVLPANVGIYQVKVTNSCGTTSSGDAELSLESIKPVWNTLIGSLDVSIPCNIPKALSNAQSMAPEVSDNCPAKVVITKTSGLFTPVGGSCSGTYLNSWIATDAAGNNSEPFYQTITIDENVGIVFTKNATDLIVECDGSGNTTELNNWLTSNAGAKAKSSCGTVSWSNNFNSIRPEFELTGIATVTFIASDGCGKTLSVEATFTVTDNTSPSPDVISLPPLVLSCTAVVPKPTATDICDGVITGKTEDPVINLSCGTYTIHWYYEDKEGNIYLQDQIVDIIDNLPPDISRISEIEGLTEVYHQCEEPNVLDDLIQQWIMQKTSELENRVNDNCGNVTISNDYDYSHFNFTCGGTAYATLDITFTFTDDCENTSTIVSKWYTQSYAPDITKGAENLVLELCNGAILNQTLLDNWLNANGYAVATWNCGSINWTNNYNEVLTEVAPGDYLITFTATNECGTEYSETQASLKLFNHNIGSIEIGPQTGTLCEGINGSNVIYDVVVTRDVCSAESFQVQLGVTSENGGMPDGIAYAFTVEYPWIYEFGPDDEEIHATMQIWSYSENAPSLQNHEITLRAFDPAIGHPNEVYGDYAEAPVPITTGSFANNIVPEKETLEDLTVECLTDAPAPIAHDICHGNTTLYGIIKSQEQVSPGIYNTTWYFDDGHGNTMEQGPQTIILDDNDAPLPDVTDLPLLTLNCGESISLIPTATDNCYGQIFAMTDDHVESLSCGPHTIHWYYEDASGNIYFQDQVVNIIDNTPPDISRISEIEGLTEVYHQCEEPNVLDELIQQWIIQKTSELESRVNDNCGNVTLTNDYEYSNFNFTCGTAYATLDITFTFTDDCENTSTIVSKWYTQSYAPEITKGAENLVLELCNGAISNQTLLDDWLNANGYAEATWNCGAINWTNNYNEVLTDVAPGDYVITFTATNECGTEYSTTQASLKLFNRNIGSVEIGPQQGYVCSTLAGRVTYNMTVTRETCSVGAFDVILGVSGSGHLEGIYDFWYEIDGVMIDGSLHFAEGENSKTITVVIFKKPVFFDGTHELTIRALDPALGHPNTTYGDYAEGKLTFSTGYPNPPVCPVIRTEFTSSDNCEVTLAEVAASNQYCTSVADFISRSDKSGPFGIGNHTINYSTSDGSTCQLSFEVKGKNIGDIQMGAQQGIICQGSPWRIEYPVTINRHICSSGEAFDLEIHFIVPEGTPDLNYGLADIQSPVHFEPGQNVKTVNVFISSNDGTYAGGYNLTLRILPAGKWAESYQGLAEYKEVSQFMQSCDPETKSAQTQAPVNNPISTDGKAIQYPSKDEKKSDVLPASVKAYPNPFKDEIKFEFSSPVDNHARLEIFNVLGSSLGVIFNERIGGGVVNTLTYRPAIDLNQFIFYRMIIGNEIYIGKLIHQK